MAILIKKQSIFLSFFLLITLCFPISAWANGTTEPIIVGNWESLSAAFEEAPDNQTVTLTLSDDIVCEDVLVAKPGCSYILEGNGHTLTDVQLEGTGNVNIQADLIGHHGMAALVATDTQVTVTGNLSTQQGSFSRCLLAYGHANVTVYGDCLDLTNEAESVVGAKASSHVIIHGDIKGGFSYTASSSDQSQLTVHGSVYAIGGKTERPVTSFDNSIMTIEGDVLGVPGTYLSGAIQNSTLIVSGSINSGLEIGPFADGEHPKAQIGGNVTNVCNTEQALLISSGSSVSIGGNVSYNSSSYPAIYLESGAILSVQGTIKNGSGDAIELNLDDSTPGKLTVNGMVSAASDAHALVIINTQGLSDNLSALLPALTIPSLSGDAPIASEIPGMVDAVQDNLSANSATPTPMATPSPSHSPSPTQNETASTQTPLPTTVIAISPQTGDSSNPVPFFILAAVSLLAVFSLIYCKRTI